MPGEFLSTEPELERRRWRVLQLRLRKMSESEIATAVQVDQSTVSRDIQWIATHWRERFGIPPGVVPAEEVGEALALYGDIEASMLRDFAALRPPSPAGSLPPLDPFIARARVECMKLALNARKERVMLLQDLQLIERRLGTLTMGLPQAADIVAVLRAVKVTPDMLVSPAERGLPPAELEG